MEQIIATLGFPIASALGLAWFIWTSQKENRIDTLRREDRMYEQMERFSDSMDNFNSTLVKIDSRLEVVEKHIEKGEL